jgi:hypothetical protein
MVYLIVELFIVFLILTIMAISVVIAITKTNKKRSIMKEQIEPMNNSKVEEKIEPMNISKMEETNFPWLIEEANTKELSLYYPPKKLELTDNIKNYVNNIIKVTPSMKNVIQKENKLILKFKDEIVEKLKTGELKLVKVKGGIGNRAIASDQKGKFVAHGKFEMQELKKLNPAQLTNAALGVMSVVTAQEYLERINQHLKSIDNKVDTLLRQIKNNKYGINKGNIEYLMLVQADLYNLSEENRVIYKGQIQYIIRESHQQIESILKEFPIMINEAASFDARTFFKLEDNKNQLSAIIKEFEDHSSLALGNLEVLSIAIKINRELSDNFTQMDTGILNNIDNFLIKIQNFENEFTKNINSLISELNAKFRTKKAISSRQDTLRKIINQLEEEVKNSYKDVKALNDDDDLSSNKEFDLQIEQDESGQIVGVYKLDKIGTPHKQYIQ